MHDFTSDHNGPARRYRVTLTGPLYVEYLHPRYGWRESVNVNTRDVARRIREIQSEGVNHVGI